MIVDGVERAISTHLDRGALELAATELVRGYGPQILGYLRAVLPAHDAEEAFAVFCEFIWKGLPGFRREASALTWSYHLAWGAARRMIEDPFRRRGEYLSTGAIEAVAQEVRSTTALHLKPETAEQLTALRAELDLDEQTLLILRVDRDLSWSECAHILDTTADAGAQARLRKRFERLVEKIRTIARRRGLLPVE